MLLSQLVGKELFYKGDCKGICLGVGVSKKNYAVKYLLCASKRATTPQRVDFVVNCSCLSDVFSGGLHLSALRPVYPKNAFFLLGNLPVYTLDGINLGRVIDGVIENGVLTSVEINEKRYSARCISACADAVILKSPAPYPIGATLPSGNGFVTKSTLKNAVKTGNLIKLTLSLSPFELKTH